MIRPGAAGGTEARCRAAQAADICDSLGAAADLTRLKSEFRRRNTRRDPQVTHRRARDGWDSLTPAEINVAALVARAYPTRRSPTG